MLICTGSSILRTFVCGMTRTYRFAKEANVNKLHLKWMSGFEDVLGRYFACITLWLMMLTAPCFVFLILAAFVMSAGWEVPTGPLLVLTAVGSYTFLAMPFVMLWRLIYLIDKLCCGLVSVFAAIWLWDGIAANYGLVSSPSAGWGWAGFVALLAFVARGFFLFNRPSGPIAVTVELLPEETMEIPFHTCETLRGSRDGTMRLAYDIAEHAYCPEGEHHDLELTGIGKQLAYSLGQMECVAGFTLSSTCFTVTVAEGWRRNDVLMNVLNVLESQMQNICVTLYDLTNDHQSDDDREIYSGPRYGVGRALLDLEAV